MSVASSARRAKAAASSIWASPTAMTWGNLAVKFVGLVVVTPLLLVKLSAGEVVVAYLFTTISSLIWLADLGFTAASSRAIAHAMGGVQRIEILPSVDVVTGVEPDSPVSRGPNLSLLTEIVQTQRRVFLVLSLAGTAVLGVAGTAVVFRPIEQSGASRAAWLAWVVLLISCQIQIFSATFEAFLQGINQVALVQRWDMMTALAGLATSALVLWAGGGLLGMVVAGQLWALVRVLRNRGLARRAMDGFFTGCHGSVFHREVWDGIWPGAWRGGLGGAAGMLTLTFGTIVAANSKDTVAAASLMLATRWITSVDQFSMAPIYAKLPLLSRLRAEGSTDSMLAVATRGMRLGYGVFVLGFICVGVVGPVFLDWIHSSVTFVTPVTWVLLGIAYFVHRVGAVHLQLVATSNRVTFHTADIVSGVIVVVVTLSLIPIIGLTAVPLGLVIGWGTFYIAFAMRQSYLSLGLRSPRLELSTSLPALGLIVLASGLFLAVG